MVSCVRTMTWIRNTSRHPDDEVRELVEFATRGIDMDRVCVNVKGGHGLSARAYDGVPSISNAPRRARYLVTIKVGNGVSYPVGPLNRNGKRPDEVGPRNRFPFFTYADWREWLVAAAAHEARHIHQYRNGEPRSELECEHFAESALARYRDARAQLSTRRRRRPHRRKGRDPSFHRSR